MLRLVWVFVKKVTLGNAYIKPFLQLPIVAFIFMLNTVFMSAWSYSTSLDFEEEKLHIVTTPDPYPIIWWHSQRYGVDWSTLTPYFCVSIVNCPQSAMDAGAYQYRTQVVPGYGTVIAYFDINGDLIGSGADLDGDGIGDNTDPDIDGDGVNNSEDQHPRDPAKWDDYTQDTDGDKVVNAVDPYPNDNTRIDNDLDGDGIDDQFDAHPMDPAKWSDVVGAVPGEFSVGPDGKASYTIPIHVSPGTAGVRPDLSLQYSSGGANDLIGVGWSLGGLSSISRCPQTDAQDSNRHFVNYTAEDRFCLDGQRLMLVGGTGSYGASGSQYRTEIDGFSRIKVLGSLAGGPEKFTVETKAGELKEYGFSSSARVTGTGGAVGIWALNKITDSVGNYIEFTYLNDADGLRPHQIRYTGNENTGLQPYETITFNYGNRADRLYRYVGGALTTISKRLTDIITSAGSYHFSYEGQISATLSRVSAISQCDNNTQCQSVRFEWQEQPAGTVWQSNPSFKPPTGIVDVDGRDRGHRFIDLNGDGVADAIRADAFGAGDNKAYLNDYVLGFSGSASTTYRIPDSSFSQTCSSPCVPSSGNSMTVATNLGEDIGFAYADLDGDGVTDIVSRRSEEDLWGYLAPPSQQPIYLYTYHSGTFLNDNDGTGWSKITGRYYPPDMARRNMDSNAVADYGVRMIDLDGDGLTDVVSSSYAGINNGTDWVANASYKTPVSLELVGVQFLELNGDGLPDLIQSKNGLRRAWLNTGAGWSGIKASWEPPVNFFDGSSRDLGVRLADLNGDGLTDILIGHTNSVGVSFRRAYINKGVDNATAGSAWDMNAFTAPPTEFTLYTNETISGSSIIQYLPSGLQLAELNGDGLVDLVFGRAGVRRAWLNTGVGWFRNDNYAPVIDILSSHPATSTSATEHRDAGIRFMDVNGDGRTDMVQGIGSTRAAWLNQSPHYVIEAFENNLGKENRVTYKPLTDPAVYTKGNAANVPEEIDLQAPQLVVSRVENSDGLGGYAAAEYEYEQMKLNKRGRGLLGFAKVTATDLNTNSRTITTYSQVFPTIGMPLTSEEQVLIGGSYQRLGYGTNHYTSMPTEATGSVFVYSDYSEEFSYHLNSGATTTTEVSKVRNETYFAPYSTYGNASDSYGNPTLIINKTFDVSGGGEIETHRMETVNAYTNNVTGSKWHLGRLTQASVTKRVYGSPVVPATTKTSSFAYDATTGLLNEEVIEPGKGVELELKTVYQHDSFGNVVKTTVCAADFNNCAAGAAGPANLPFRTSEAIFDAQGRFATTLKNALGETEILVYDPVFGNVTSSTGPNLITTLSFYDGFGRKIREERADGTQTTTDYAYCTSCAPVPLVTGTMPKYKVTVTTTGSAPAVEYFDKLGRSLRQQAVGFNGALIFTDTEYNNKGQVTKVSEPYFSGDTVYDTVSHYDVVGRVEKVEPADGSPDVVTVFNGYETITQRKQGTSVLRSTSKVDNIIGQTKTVTDELGSTTGYEYDSQGNVTTTTVTGGGKSTVVTVGYNILGRKTSMIDPDMGSWTYEYNSYGELTSQTDAKLQTISMKYDKLGRLVERTEAEGVSTWVYGDSSSYTSTNRNIGKLIQIRGPESNAAAPHTDALMIKALNYDELGRPKNTTTTLNVAPYVSSKSYSSSQTYDSNGRVDIVTYPQVGSSSFKVQNVYNTHGYLEQVRDPVTTTTVHWEAMGMNARGQLEHAKMASGALTDIRTFRDANGFLDDITVTNSAGTVYQMDYNFDAYGNIDYRYDQRQGRTEHFEYDGLDRLRRSYVITGGPNAGATPIAGTDKGVTYDELGNITSKTDVGHYKYGSDCATTSTLPHAVCEIYDAASGGTLLKSYSYDANGNMTSGAGRTVGYTSFNKPYQFDATGSDSVTFHYGAERSRVFKVGGTRTTAYVGLGAQGNPLYQHETDGGTDKHLHFIYAGGQSVATHTITDNGTTTTNTTEYLLRDHLGSVEVVTDSAGVAVNYMSHDAWGKRRNTDWTDAAGTLPNAPGNIGFTGHEAITEIGLVHMNGRVYDPVLGRFLSADPNIQFAGDTQSYNRYSYVSNNPLKYTDPSGYFLSRLLDRVMKFTKRLMGHISRAMGQIRQYALPIMALAIAIMTQYPGGLTAFQSGALAGLVGSGGDIKAALIGGITAGIFNKLGVWGEGKHISTQMLAHGATGGALTALQGGKFKHGFTSSFLTKGIMPDLHDSVNRFVGAMVSAAVGGAISQVSGGKFANGARNAAFAYLFNQGSHKNKNPVSNVNEGETFAERFKGMTGGLELNEAISQYNARTGEALTPDVVEKLFTDPSFAESMLLANKNLHTIFRDSLNANVPTTKLGASEAGWTKMPFYKNLFHGWYKGNVKFVSPDGYREAVYSSRGSLVTDNKHKGTFNFYDPNTDAAGHWDADVVPYKKWGN